MHILGLGVHRSGEYRVGRLPAAPSAVCVGAHDESVFLAVSKTGHGEARGIGIALLGVLTICIAVDNVVCRAGYLIPGERNLTVSGNCINIADVRAADRSCINRVVIRPGVPAAIYPCLYDESVFLAVCESGCCEAVGFGVAEFIVSAVDVAVNHVVLRVLHSVPCERYLTVSGDCLHILGLGVLNRSCVNSVCNGPVVPLAVYPRLYDESVFLAVYEVLCGETGGSGGAEVMIAAVYITVNDVVGSAIHSVPGDCYLFVAGNRLYVLRLVC